MKDLLLAYYGDDFTGSTDALESLCCAGVKTVLFLERPSDADLEAFPDLMAFGIAGNTRALARKEIGKAIALKMHTLSVKSRHFHYKVCSTFDSSPEIGSIGEVIEWGLKIFGNQIIPLIGGTPALGRYCVFGNLFAKMGIGSNGDIYRLDRHPSMSKHPVTPANESDLRLHLSKQTKNSIGLIDILQLAQPIESWTKHLQSDEKVVLVDALYDEQLTKIGEWLESQYTGGRAVFSIGGSSVEMALGKYWNNQGITKPVIEWPKVVKISPLLVISGSCSPVTAAQIAWAKINGFKEVIIDAAKICNDDVIDAKVFEQVNNFLKENKNVIVHTGTKQKTNLSSEKLGTALGSIAKKAVKIVGIKRIIVSGGDTSSYAARAMEINAVEMIVPMVKGAPLCKIHSKNALINGLEVNFKGGQVGSENYFGLF